LIAYARLAKLAVTRHAPAAMVAGRVRRRAGQPEPRRRRPGAGTPLRP
jgi:hypothetical protein